MLNVQLFTARAFLFRTHLTFFKEHHGRSSKFTVRSEAKKKVHTSVLANVDVDNNHWSQFMRFLKNELYSIARVDIVFPFREISLPLMHFEMLDIHGKIIHR